MVPDSPFLVELMHRSRALLRLARSVRRIRESIDTDRSIPLTKTADS
jgi:hypothetical protein